MCVDGPTDNPKRKKGTYRRKGILVVDDIATSYACLKRAGICDRAKITYLEKYGSMSARMLSKLLDDCEDNKEWENWLLDKFAEEVT